LICLFCKIPSIEQYAMRAFASALDAIPLALAENSGLSPIETLANVKSEQITKGSSMLGIDCLGKGENGIWIVLSCYHWITDVFHRHEEAVRV